DHIGFLQGVAIEEMPGRSQGRFGALSMVQRCPGRPGPDPQRRLGFLDHLINHDARIFLWPNQVPPWPCDTRSRDLLYVGGRRMSEPRSSVRDSSLRIVKAPGI